MDGPDLSHLLDRAEPEHASSEVLQSIVRRHRRLKARRARTAASLGLVIALAGLGTGIALSHNDKTTSAAGTMRPTTTRAGAFGTSTVTTLGRGGSSYSATPSASKLALGKAPAGLRWVSTGTGSSAAASAPDLGLHATGSASGQVAEVCTTIDCSSQLQPDLVGYAALQPLFTRTSGAVTVRAFSASWAVAPIEIGPISSGSGSSSSSGGSVGSTGSSGAVSSSPPVTVTVPGDTKATDTTIPQTTIPDSTTLVPPTPSTTTTVISGVTETTTPISGPLGSVPALNCEVTKALVVEVSDAGAVGVVTVPFGPSLDKPIDVLMDDVVGVAEESPIVVVVAHTNTPTASVRADFGIGGQDQMDVVNQWAVLVKDLGPSGAGGGDPELLGQATVSALSGDGTVLEQADLAGSGALAMPVAACGEPSSKSVMRPIAAESSTTTTTQVRG